MSKYKYSGSELEHRVVWEAAHGPIPKGYVIHHIDGNGKNNDLSNLRLMTQKEHLSMHAKARANGTDVVDRTDPDVVESINRHKRYREKYPERVREATKKYRETHREQVRETMKRWREENPEVVARHKRAHYLKHREEICAKQKKYAAEHKEEIREQRRKYDAEHREEQKVRAHAWKQKHHDQVLDAHRSYNEQHRDLIAAKAKLAGEKRKTLHYDPEAVRRAEEAVQRAYAREIELGIRKQ